MESEHEPPEYRRLQAVEQMRGAPTSELRALKQFTEKGCPSTPELFGHKQENQGPGGFVPGGWALYLLMEKLPGRRLGADNLWEELPEFKQFKIWAKFKEAWMCVYALPYLSFRLHADSPFWIGTGFQHTSEVQPDDGWTNDEYFQWGLKKMDESDRARMCGGRSAAAELNNKHSGVSPPSIHSILLPASPAAQS